MLIGQVTELSPFQDYDVIFERDDGAIGVYGVLKIEEGFLKNDDYGLMNIQRVLMERHAEYSFDYRDGWFRFAAEIPE